MAAARRLAGRMSPHNLIVTNVPGWGLNADHDLMPDLGTLANDIAESFAEPRALS